MPWAVHQRLPLPRNQRYGTRIKRRSLWDSVHGRANCAAQRKPAERLTDNSNRVEDAVVRGARAGARDAEPRHARTDS